MAQWLDQGMQSQNELNMDAVLKSRATIEYSAQYPLDGGRDIRGGQVIDFVIWEPLRYALNLGSQGGYWHSGARSMEDIAKQEAQRQAGFMVILFADEETATYEDAYRSYMQKVGL